MTIAMKESCYKKAVTGSMFVFVSAVALLRACALLEVSTAQEDCMNPAFSRWHPRQFALSFDALPMSP